MRDVGRLERAMYWRDFRRNWPVAPFIPPLAAVYFIVYMLAWMPYAQKRDVRDTSLHEAASRLDSVSYLSGGRGAPRYQVWTHIQGKPVRNILYLSDVAAQNWMPEAGQAIRVQYRVGRSGKIYVEQVIPVR